jgi:ABC-type metal ion transport system substrate-binding protein
MKILMLVLSILLVSAAYAGDDEDVQYRVEIKVVYNSVSADEMAKLAKRVAKEDGPACEVEVVVKKATSYGGWITLGSSGQAIVTTDPN